MASKIKIETKVPTEREFKRLHWTLRETKKFEMVEATRTALLNMPKPENGLSEVVIEVGGGANPENYFLAPVFSVLRSGGWIADDTAVVLKRGKLNGIIVTL
jgi:hypothetical protein